MSYYAQQQVPPPPPPHSQAYPAPADGQTAYRPTYVAAPPPAGYPARDGAVNPPQQVPVETRSRGDGFWEGCCAALCCCCLLDMCY